MDHFVDACRDRFKHYELTLVARPVVRSLVLNNVEPCAVRCLDFIRVLLFAELALEATPVESIHK